MPIDNLLFAVLPYVTFFVAILGLIRRFRSARFSLTSRSTQFLENRQLFWGSIPWHYGIVIILIGHLIAFLIPRSLLAWNGVPWRLYVLEASALALGFLSLTGIILLIIRRASSARIRAITSSMDILVLLLLLTLVVAGLWTAIFYRWGSTWYAGFAVPYIWSILKLNPDISLISNLPLMVKVHITGAYLLVMLLPYTRLVHFLLVPVTYLWRPYQVVIWNRRKTNHG